MLTLRFFQLTVTSICAASIAVAADTPARKAQPGLPVGAFPAELRRTFTKGDGLPDNEILGLATDARGRIWATTARGLARREADKWITIGAEWDDVRLIAPHRDAMLATAQGKLYLVADGKPELLAELPLEARDPLSQRSLTGGSRILLGTRAGLFEFQNGAFAPVEQLNALAGPYQEIRQVDVAADGRVVVAAKAGLFLLTPGSDWEPVYPRDAERSWASHDVRGAVFDAQGRMWFASPQGVGVRDDEGWTLYTGYEGLPYNEFTTMAAGENGAVWFGTTRGAIRFDGTRWQYRMAPRWLPDDHVRAMVIAKDGSAYFATSQGVGLIERRPMTLAAKARFFEEEIDKYHRRTPYGYVLAVHLDRPGDKSSFTQHDSDNDGLWTAMYGAGECFAFAATKDPIAKQRATAAFEALRFLSQVTQGGSHPAPQGFPARTILPTSGQNPNETHNTSERDREEQKRDPLWKVIVPRWPTSADGQWYWKSDTSSDELDGHYFLYACYYDLVAETDEEKRRVREVVAAVTDHLIEHDYELIDHDGQPTRWARFGPKVLNGNILPGCRGLNSLSILSYLKVAEHMTGDAKYRQAYDTLVNDHSYATNTLDPKRRNGPGTGNQSDDEMAFMCYYNLLNYETDSQLRKMYLWSMRWYWILEEPERCPLFNFIFAARDDEARIRSLEIPTRVTFLSDAVDTLKRLPLDRVQWPYDHRHRKDIVTIPSRRYRLREGGYLRSGHVIPIDERSVEHWSYDAWHLDEGHDGRTLADGAVFLLPYYMGLYHGFILDSDSAQK